MQIHPPRPQPLCTTAKRPHTLIASPQARIASPIAGAQTLNAVPNFEPTLLVAKATKGGEEIDPHRLGERRGAPVVARRLAGLVPAPDDAVDVVHYHFPPPPPPRSPVPRTRLGISVTGNRRVESRGSPAWCVRGCRRFYEGLHPAWGWIGLGFGAEAAAAARRRRGGRRRRREEEEEIKGERKAERRGEEKRWKILDSARVIDSSGSSVTGNFILRLSVGKTYQRKYLRFREPSGISSAWDGVFGFRGSSEKLIP